MSGKILVTGGAGYLGSHTILELIAETGYEVISVDNFANSSPEVFERIHAICGIRVKNYAVDLCDREAVEVLWRENIPLAGVIHFAAFKSVPESVQNPYKYYHNNINTLLNILRLCERTRARHLIFSSSCSVYGNVDELPVSENTAFNQAESPYAHTKQMGEAILEQYAKTDCSFRTIALRYFNPVGAHRSGRLGELPLGVPSNLIPVITQTGIGKRPSMSIYGNDYPTRDGTCIRDYVHVSDIADAHVKALQILNSNDGGPKYDVINLGTGSGVSVLEAIKSFETNNGVKINYTFAPRRPGDVAAIYSDPAKAQKVLGWSPRFALDEMVRTAWAWEKNLSGAPPSETKSHS